MKLFSIFYLVFFSLVLLNINSCAADKRFGDGRLSDRQKKTDYSYSTGTYEGVSSYYGPKFHGKLTASGEKFDMYQMTAAHKTLPFGTKIKVTNLDNGKSVIVKINDRGPFVKGRILDLSLGAAKQIDMISSGIANVRIEVVSMPQ